LKDKLRKIFGPVKSRKDGKNNKLQKLIKGEDITFFLMAAS